MELLDGKYQIDQFLGQGGMGAVYRATHLGTKRTVTIVQFALPILMWRAAVSTEFSLQLNDDFTPKQFSFNFSMSGWSSLYQLLNVFITPLTAIMTSLLYLKTRKAGGESLRDASDQFEALDIPRSRWQARMRSRLSTHTSQR